MVGVAEEAELDRLEKQVDGGRKEDTAQYLSLVRKLKVRRSEKVALHGLALLNSPSAASKLGDDVWTVYEQVAIAAMDCNCLDVAKECITALMKKFPDSNRVGRLEGMWMEAKGYWQQAEKVYESLLEVNATDPFLHKRKVAMAKAQGNFSGAVEALNKYLETFMADHDAWRELAELYISLLMYKQAAFCYEELILAQPTNALYHLGYAELLYTIGGLENLRAAKKYYSATIELSGGRNIRALYGVVLKVLLFNLPFQIHVGCLIESLKWNFVCGNRKVGQRTCKAKEARSAWKGTLLLLGFGRVLCEANKSSAFLFWPDTGMIRIASMCRSLNVLGSTMFFRRPLQLLIYLCLQHGNEI
ncbi:hypothetical protein Mp_5g22660 [Marchantia polymorpha subsp. ruderalis]|uniref:ER membrane protein complex subunit 2 n=2 Tax=Marchantia polymorpha TaxID=3197 RepID=A0AAF6BL76_MARPO|nr:hypothetical protein MARPO_0010s0190 [Marchantia polymorpha]BBN12760.1 hypothetical protein Mp_5g22660 [Marchantia polymorpha subsp. ruderalis]|eukprot:PTQ46821.1 hypothetical protein MARPO_0010s0190 [Marchantia polymorpha]